MRAAVGRAAVLGSLAWLAATGVTGTIAWRAVAVLDADAATTGVLSASGVASALDEARAAASARPTTSPPVAVPTAGPPSPTDVEVARTWTLAGGTVAAACTGPVIALLYATPSDGWTVEVDAAGPAEIRVELHRGSTELDVRATCVGGEPVQKVDDDAQVATGTPADQATSEPAEPSDGGPSTVPTPRESESEDTHEDEKDESPGPSPSPSPSESHR